MARKGQHNLALGVALGASTISVIVGYVILLFSSTNLRISVENGPS